MCVCAIVLRMAAFVNIKIRQTVQKYKKRNNCFNFSVIDSIHKDILYFPFLTCNCTKLCYKCIGLSIAKINGSDENIYSIKIQKLGNLSKLYKSNCSEPHHGFHGNGFAQLFVGVPRRRQHRQMVNIPFCSY
jgi:hypothetical protein